MNLTEHGAFQVYFDNAIIYLYAAESFNAESSKACIDAIDKVVTELKGEQFAVIADCQSIEGITQDSNPLWFDAVNRWVKAGHSAFVRIDDPSSAHYEIFTKPFDEFFIQRIDFDYRGDFTSAVQHLNAKGYPGFANGLDEVFLVAKNEE